MAVGVHSVDGLFYPMIIAHSVRAVKATKSDNRQQATVPSAMNSCSLTF